MLSRTCYNALLAVLVVVSYLPMSLNAQVPVAPPQKTAGQQSSTDQVKSVQSWGQWRGPKRDGTRLELTLPTSLQEANLSEVWSKPLGPSYSGPIVAGNMVFVTESKDKQEVVTAFDLEKGAQVWTTSWEGSMRVPFFAMANGSWIRATPTLDDGMLYVCGMKDVLVCIDAKTGEQQWKRDFPTETGSAVPSFGFVCSPLIDGNDLYVQAAEGFVKLNKKTGETIWTTLKDGGGMNGSAFSSPVIATIAGKRQLVILQRSGLCGVDAENGSQLWSQPVKTYRGMNILTPSIFGDNVFTSTYGGTTEVFSVSREGSSFSVANKWSLPVQGYMSSPVIIGNHAYVHLRNQRFACFDLANGVEKWRSQPFGKYSSLVATDGKILALDQKGKLLLLSANPEKFELIDSRTVGDDSWAHVALTKDHVVVRNLKNVTVFKWADGAVKLSAK